MACDLELVSFAFVDSVVLFLFPFFNIFNICSLDFGIISVIPLTITPLLGSSLKSKFSLLLINKSLIFSLYISKYHNLIVYSLSGYDFIFSNNSFNVRDIIPGFSSVPNIVYVLPAPVAPYANTVALKPFVTPSIKNFVVQLNISFWPSN